MLMCNAHAGSVVSMESLRGPLLELVRQQKVTNTYLRNSATLQYKYTTSQATQHRDPTFKQSLVQVRSWRCRMRPPSHLHWRDPFPGGVNLR